MTLRTLVERTRALLQDFGGDREVAWGLDDSGCNTSNAQLVAFLDGGRTEYRTRNPIRDSVTPAVCQVTATVGGVGRVALDPRVLAVRAVTLAADRRVLRFGSARVFDHQDRTGTWRTESGTPTHWLAEDDGVLQLYPIPSASLGLALEVERLPLAPLLWSAADAAVDEMPAAHVEALKYWAAAQVLMDRDERNPAGLAAGYLARFEEIAGPAVSRADLRVRARLAAGGLTIPGPPAGRRGWRWV